MIVFLAATALADTYALRESLPVEIRNPIGGRWTTSVTTAEWVVDWEQEGDDVTWKARLCAIETPPAFGAQTVYSDAFVAGTPLRVRQGTLDDGTFVAGPLVEVVGEGDPDRDGNPGVSVGVRHPQVGSGALYVEQQARLAYTGAATEDGFAGTIDYASDLRLLGASTWWLRMIPTLQRSSPELGRFELVRVDGDDCAAVAAVWP